MTEVKKRGAPLGSKNHLGKFKNDAATTHIHMRCKPSDKALWVKTALNNGGLSAWVTKMLNEASKIIE